MNLFIISYNRLTFLKQQLEFFLSMPGIHVHIIDNHSTYEPLNDLLLNYPKAAVHFMKNNFGHKVIWEKNISKEICPDEPYMVTDNDIIPEDKNFVDLLLEGLEKFPDANKIGLGLRTDDIPDHYPFKEKVIAHEQFILASEGYFLRDTGFIKAPVDTTLAIYRGGYHEYSLNALRTTRSLAKHLSWYMTEEEMKNEENKFYYESMKDGSTHWSYMQARSLIKPRRRR